MLNEFVEICVHIKAAIIDILIDRSDDSTGNYRQTL